MTSEEILREEMLWEEIHIPKMLSAQTVAGQRDAED